MTHVTSDTPQDPQWTVDDLARRADLPVRTIREYQTMGLLHRPRRSGRIGLYDRTHLRRLQLIARLQQRGHSLAGIGDLLTAWQSGAAITDVLSLEPDQLVHVDEPGAPATLAQLGELVPSLVPDRIEELVATGVIDACGPERYCVPSPSLLQVAVDAADAGLGPDALLDLLDTIRAAADTATDAVFTALAQLPPDVDRAHLEQVVGRGRGLLAHGLGRLMLHRIGRRVGADDADTTEDIARLLLDRGAGGAAPRSSRRGRRT